jgi:hypothetical protein
MLGRESVEKGVGKAAIGALVSFAFFFVADLSGSWKSGSLHVGAWFAWLVFGAIGILFVEIVVLGDVQSGFAGAVIYSTVLSAVWYGTSPARGAD